MARIALDDPEPTAVAVEGLALLSFEDRKRANDAQPRHSRENLGSAERGAEPFLHSGIGWRSAARGFVHPGIAAVPAATGLGAVAVDPEEIGRASCRERGEV